MVSYKKLWKLLIDKDMKKQDLIAVTGISTATMQKLNKGENLNTDILGSQFGLKFLDALLLGIQMMFSFMLTDGQKPLRICKHCQKAYAANHPNAVFCSPRCKNQYNVYKSRANKAASNGAGNSKSNAGTIHSAKVL